VSDLYPRFDMPDIVGAVESQEVAFPKSWLWDWDICDFVQTGGGDVVEADGLTAWVQWCVKAILTQRLAYVVYDWDYGADIESCLKQPTRAVTEAELEREITEALLIDPRTAEVKNFSFEWSGDELTVRFVVVNALGQPAEVQVGVGYREVQRQFSLLRVEQYVSDWMSGTLVGVEVNDRGRLTLIETHEPLSGYRLSKPIYLKSLGTCNGSNISWEANIPAGCDVKVYASVDGSTFQECENNAPIPSLSEGVSLVDKVLVIKEVLLTEDGVNRPELMVVRYNVDGTVTLRG